MDVLYTVQADADGYIECDSRGAGATGGVWLVGWLVRCQIGFRMDRMYLVPRDMDLHYSLDC